MPQFVALHGRTFRDNLRQLSQEAAWAEIVRVARQTGLDDWVQTLPMGYDTALMPLAGGISGGQRQLVALTAALASNRRLLLLDEPMANLDSMTQHRISHCDAIAARTVIYAAHDGPVLTDVWA